MVFQDNKAKIKHKTFIKTAITDKKIARIYKALTWLYKNIVRISKIINKERDTVP